MNAQSKNQYPKQEVPGRFAKLLGKFAIGEAPMAEQVDWEKVAQAATPVARQERGKPGSNLYYDNPIAQTKTQAGMFRRLHGVMLVGSERFGLVSEASAQSSAPDRFLLTAVGEGQKSGTVLRQVEFAELQQPRGAGYIQPWEDFRIGRASENDVVTYDDPSISRQHAFLRVSGDKLEMFDSSTNGTRYLSGANYNGTPDSDLVEAWNTLADNPALWSGEYGGGTVVVAQ